MLKKKRKEFKKEIKNGVIKRNPKGFGWLEVEGEKRSNIFVAPPQMRGLDDGDLVSAEILDSEKGLYAKNVALKTKYKPSIANEIGKIIAETDVVIEFPEAVTGQAEKFGKAPNLKDKKKRADLTSLPFVTIDGKTAKDFDDAVFSTMREGKLIVFVAIADVSHYVEEDTALDKEAVSRGTSIYYPGKCIPMLPEVLSNGLCSLVPDEDRLSMVAEYEVTARGKAKLVAVYEAVIKSHKRLTYEEVQRYLDNKKSKAELKISKPIASSLDLLEKASGRLRKERARRGAIDFDLVESVIALDDFGEPILIHPSARQESNRIIEDLMVATNEVVADFLTSRGVPAIFRVHETPSDEKIEGLISTLQKAAVLNAGEIKNLKQDLSPKNLSKIAEKIKKLPSAATYEILLLRSMMQARYAAENLGHFGLASTGYLHFTSPIRRYPDLMVHRLVKLVLNSKSKNFKTPKNLEEKLDQLAEHCSACEKRAVGIERKISSLHAAWYMKDKIGEEDTGTITGCAEFGIFLKLKKYHVEGLLHVSKLRGGYFEYDPVGLRLVERGGKISYGIGDQIEVIVENANVEKRFIDLGIAGSAKKENKGNENERRQAKSERRGQPKSGGKPKKPRRSRQSRR